MTTADRAQQRLQELAARLEPSLRSAFLALAASLTPESLAELVRLLEAGELDAAAAYLTGGPRPLAAAVAVRSTFAAGLIRLVQTVTRDLAVGDGGRRLVIAAPVSSPDLIAAVRRWEDQAFARVLTDVREGVRETIATELQRGINPRQVAVALKDRVATGGLTAYDVRIVANFRAELESGRFADAKRRALRDRRYAIKGTLTPAKIDEMVAAYERKLVAFRAETFARTAAIQAANEASAVGWRAAVAQGAVPAAEVRRYWVTAQDERLCKICAPVPSLNETGTALDGAFVTPNGPALSPPLHPNCVLGDTPITASPAIHAVTQRHFEGPIVVIETASGKRLACTENHPVLTPSGWVAAGRLHEGGDVIRYLGTDRIPAIGDHHEDVPPRIEQIAETFGRSAGVSAVEVPVSPEHFHGDGSGSEVAVVWTDGDLRNAGDAALSEERSERHLAFTGMESTPLSSQSATAQLSHRHHAPTSCFMCGGELSTASGGVSDRGPLGSLGFTRVAELDAVAEEESTESGAAYAALARQLIDGLSGDVAVDQILRIHRFKASTHVFNLETEGGWYAADGIITHNCRCTVWIRRERRGVRQLAQPGTTRLLQPR